VRERGDGGKPEGKGESCAGLKNMQVGSEGGIYGQRWAITESESFARPKHVSKEEGAGCTARNTHHISKEPLLTGRPTESKKVRMQRKEKTRKRLGKGGRRRRGSSSLISRELK